MIMEPQLISRRQLREASYLSGSRKVRKISMLFRLEADDFRLFEEALLAHVTTRRMANRDATLVAVVQHAMRLLRSTRAA